MLGKARIALHVLPNEVCSTLESSSARNPGCELRDLTRLNEQANDLKRIEAEAIEGIAMKEAYVTTLRRRPLDMKALAIKK